MKWLFYRLLFVIVYWAMMPSFLLRMKKRGGYKARMGDRFGWYPRKLALPPYPVWIHAVSVGEVAVAGQLMRAMRAEDPSIRFVFSTTSSTGWQQATRELAPGDALIYYPLDFTKCVRRALDRIAPRTVILTESEIWPTFIRAVAKRGVPLFLVNARVSDRSAPRYRLLRWWFGEVLRCFTAIFAQSDMDAQRLIAAGADASKIQVTGSFKFDVAHRNPLKEQAIAEWIRSGEMMGKGTLLPGLDLTATAGDAALPPILLGGSTWPGEDEALLRVYREVTHINPAVRLVLVPRHFEKADEIEVNILRAGYGCLRRSTNTRRGPKNVPTVYLGDTTGELMGFYACATVVFVGKSLWAHGAQNMIEPCLCGKPVVVGPYTENFRPVMSDLLAAEALLQVANEEALQNTLLHLFSDEESCRALGARASAAVTRRCGVVARCAHDLLAALPAPAEDLAVQPKNAVVRKSRKGMKLAVCVALALAYAFMGWWSTPRIKHAWLYLQQNATRQYSTFVGLSAASILFPWCLDDLRTAYIHLATRDYGFAKGVPYRSEIKDGHKWDYYRDEDYGGDVILQDGWPFETGAKFKATRLLIDLIPYAEGAAAFDPNRENPKAWGDDDNRVFGEPVPYRHIDARLLSFARLKGILEECRDEFGPFKLWVVGRYDYLVTPACAVAADRLLALFDDPRAFSRFAEAGIYSAADLYACYTGTDKDVFPALEAYPSYGPLRGLITGTRLAFSPPPTGAREEVRPSRITPLAPVAVSGLVSGGAEQPIYDSLTNRIFALQLARREALQGSDAAERGAVSNALAHWAQAATINPRDPILRNLADSLDLEGRRRLRVGDVNGALQCYENRIVVSPYDTAAIYNFGVCLRKAGRMDIAARVFLKVITMNPKEDAPRAEFVTCAAASGHLGAATRQMQVLVVRHADDPHLKMRLARLLVQSKNELHDDARAIRLAEEAVVLTKWRDSALVRGLADVYIEAGRTLMGMGLKKRMREMKFDR